MSRPGANISAVMPGGSCPRYGPDRAANGDDMLSFELGVGYRKDDVDSGYAPGDEDPETLAVYLQSVIALAPGVYVIPEVGYFDEGKNYDDTDGTTTFYLGANGRVPLASLRL